MRFLYLYTLCSFLLNCSQKERKEKDVDNCIKYASDLNFNSKNRLKYNDRAFAYLTTLKSDSLNNSRLILVAKNYWQLNNWRKLKKTAHFILRKNGQGKSGYITGQSYRYLGYYYENVSINDSAFYFFSKAEKIFDSLKNMRLICQINIDKCLLQYYTNDYFGSELSAIKALKIAKRYKFVDSEYDGYIYLNMNSEALHDYLSAIKYGNKSVKLIKQNPLKFNPQDLAYSLKTIGSSYYHLKKPYEALNYFELALSKDLQCQKYPVTYSNLVDSYAQVLLELKRYKSVEKLHFLASKIRDSLNIDQGKNWNRLFLSKYYQTMGQQEKAKSFAYQALELSKSFCAPKDILASLTQLSNVDPQNALKYSREYIRISDSMQQLERETRNKFAKIAYETEEITKEKETAVKNNRIILITAAGIILILTLLFIIKAQRAKQKQLEFERAQQKANEEIYNLLLDKQNTIDQGRKIEKKRIAQDLHDSIMNRLASTRLNLQNIVENPTAENLKKYLPFIDGIQDIEKEIRNIAHDLNRGAFSNAISFVATIESFVEEHQALGNRKFHLQIDPDIDWDLISNYQKIHIFRIIQESFQNINKHSGARSVMMSFLKKEDHILLEIFDDGNGFPFNEKKKGIGLQNIFSRAHACGGSAQVNSRMNEGTTIIIKIPT